MNRNERRKIIRKSKVFRKRSFLLLTLCLVFALGTLAMGGERGRERKVYYESIKIQKGDTLWDIAIEYKNETEEIEQMVKKIMKFNAMGSANIKAGESIIIPVTVLR